MKALIYLKNNFYKLLYYFFLFSFLGYFWEVSKHFALYHNFVNRGTFYGPILPIYGLAVVVGYLVLDRFKNTPLKLFVLSGLLCNIIELGVSYLSELAFHVRYWDYTKYPFNLDGRICLYSFLLFGLFGFLCIKYLLPYCDKLYGKLNKKNFKGVLLFLLLIFLIDVVYTFQNPHTGKSISYTINEKSS